MKASITTMATAMAACLLTLSAPAAAQTDTLGAAKPDTAPQLITPAPADAATDAAPGPYRFRPGQIVLPALAIGFGVIGLESDWLKGHNTDTRHELQENIGHRLTLDDVTQYVPMAANYGLRLCGVRGLHDYADLTIILGTSYALMGTTVQTLKMTTRVMRPDGSSRNSFPSGHTATAFLGAEILRREYWDVSPWIGVAGYAVAAGTGFFRMYNDRHWLTDVVAGAGIGILAAEAGYWLYPFMARTIFSGRLRKNALLSRTSIAPYASRESKGVGITIRL